MPTPRLIPFRAQHLLAFEDRDGWAVRDWPLAMEQERERLAFTMLVGDRILACAGVGRLQGVWKAWVRATDAAFAYRLFVTRTVRQILRDAVRALGIPRIEAVALADSERNCRWIEALGFRRDPRHPAAVIEQDRALFRYEYLPTERAG